MGNDEGSGKFGPYTTALEAAAGYDLSGRTALVTGGGAGIGLETVRALAAAGAEVVVAARNPAAVEPAVREVAPAARLEPLELADLTSVRSLAERWGDRPLHYLINNAGVMAVPFSRSAEGVETHLAVNHLGHFLLSVLLLPALQRAGGARVVSLASGAHQVAGVDFADPNFERRPYNPMVAYGQSKTANILFAAELDRLAAARGVRAFSVMPGVIRTGLFKHTPADAAAAIEERLRDQVKTPEQGASTTVWAATAAELDDRGGLYLEDCAIAGPADATGHGLAPHAQDPEGAARLWRWSAEVAGAPAV